MLHVCSHHFYRLQDKLRHEDLRSRQLDQPLSLGEVQEAFARLSSPDEKLLFEAVRFPNTNPPQYYLRILEVIRGPPLEPLSPAMLVDLITSGPTLTPPAIVNQQSTPRRLRNGNHHI